MSTQHTYVHTYVHTYMELYINVDTTYCMYIVVLVLYVCKYPVHAQPHLLGHFDAGAAVGEEAEGIARHSAPKERPCPSEPHQLVVTHYVNLW